METHPGRHLVVAAALLLAAGAALAEESSVVRLVNYAQRGEWYTPWAATGVFERTGSGFVVDGGLIMTNAHVVSDSRQLLLFLYNDPEPHAAEVFRVAHDCDLALVRPLEPGLLDGVPRLEFGGLPRLGTTVQTLGYPTGGTRISSTKGIISRIEELTYVHPGNHRHQAVQTDAAINPGNSGGPVLQDGRVVGVAFQTNPDLQNIGYFIPVEVIQRFLRDVADGIYDGYPELALEVETLTNTAARRRAGLAKGESGVRVEVALPDGSADGLVESGDVLLQVDGRVVANDGTVRDDEGRIPAGLLVDRKQIGETVSVRVLRAGDRFDVEVPLRAYPYVNKHGNVYDRLPRYYVYAGLVFVPLDLQMLETFGSEWPTEADKELLHELYLRPAAETEMITAERVVLLRRLDHPVNADMAWHRNEVVERVNGVSIRRLEDLVEAIESHEGEFHFIEFSSHRRFSVLERREAERSHEEILERYGVPGDRRL